VKPPVLCAAVLGLGLACPPLSAQDATPGGVTVTVAVSADTIALGDRLELLVTVLAPPGRVALFPDTLPATTHFESLAPVVARTRERDDGSTEITLTYPLIAFGIGLTTTPAFEISLGPDPSSGGTAATGRTRFTIAGQRVWVASVLLLEDIAQGLEPRPADDVVGGDWNLPAVLLTLGFTALIGAVVTVGARDLLEARTSADRTVQTPLDPLEAARLEALGELDRLDAHDWHREGRIVDFYDRSSAAIRGYVEHLHPSWNRSYTSSELMRGLEAARSGDAAPDLLREMRMAEAVKFGHTRPTATAAEVHWRTLRDWVASRVPELSP
jgi:hypothetical protein